MFWILRRTGAANFFNSFSNNNCSYSKNNTNGGNNNTQDKHVKRPPRKAYGRLSAEADDAVSLGHKIDDPFDELDDFEMLAANSRALGNNGNRSSNNGNANNGNSNDEAVAEANGNGNNHGNGNGNGNSNGNENLSVLPCTDTDCQGNFMVDNALCELGLCQAKAKTSNKLSAGGTSATSKEINENTISRLHVLAMANDDDDDDDYDESLTCNVCDRAFHCHRQLASHQQKKRHFGCSGCDSLFPSLMLLEHHKEEFEHWSDEEIGRRICCRRNRCDDDYFTDTDSFISDAESEDLERLL